MSFLFNFFSYNNVDNNNIEKEKEFSEDDYVKVEGDKIYISTNDIKNVSLKKTSIKRSVKKNKELLDCILEVKLKSTPKICDNKSYEPRHPCLKELINKIPKKS